MYNKKYVLVESKDRYELAKEVNILVEQGYKPVGGIAVSVFSVNAYYTQAMIKED